MNSYKLPLIVGVIALVITVGVGIYVTDAFTYMGSDSTTCNNCHVMDSAYENWFHAPHQKWTDCSDCHTPQALIPHYYIKAKSGIHDVAVFSFGAIPVKIRANEETREIIQENCVRCHEDTVSTLLENPMPMDRYCFECHRSVAHGERGISGLPYQHQEQAK
jgi:cytochrome c nitrite reductase small subunit